MILVILCEFSYTVLYDKFQVEDLDLLVEHVDSTNFRRTCLYLTSSARWMERDNILDVQYSYDYIVWVEPALIAFQNSYSFCFLYSLSYLLGAYLHSFNWLHVPGLSLTSLYWLHIFHLSCHAIDTYLARMICSFWILHTWYISNLKNIQMRCRLLYSLIICRFVL